MNKGRWESAIRPPFCVPLVNLRVPAYQVRTHPYSIETRSNHNEVCFRPDSSRKRHYFVVFLLQGAWRTGCDPDCFLGLLAAISSSPAWQGVAWRKKCTVDAA